MSSFKQTLIFKEGDILKTHKGEETNWTYLEDVSKNGTTGKRYIKAKCKCGPVDEPVLPTVAITSFFFTLSPTETLNLSK